MGLGVSKEEQVYMAVQKGDSSAVQALRAQGASLEWVDNRGRTPLMIACSNPEYYDVAATLLQLGANVKAYRTGPEGGFPLHHAAKKGLDRTVALLFAYGGEALAMNDAGQTPIDLARVRRHLGVVRMLELMSGPALFEALASSWVFRNVWVVVLPGPVDPRRRPDPRMPPCLQLFLYPSPKVTMPTTVIHLEQAEVSIAKPESPDPVLVINDIRNKTKYKLLADRENGGAQPPFMTGPHFNSIPAYTAVPSGMPPVRGQLPSSYLAGPAGRDEEPDVALQMAINASLEHHSGGRGGEDYGGWAALGPSSNDDDLGGWGGDDAGSSRRQPEPSAAAAAAAAPQLPPSRPPPLPPAELPPPGSAGSGPPPPAPYFTTGEYAAAAPAGGGAAAAAAAGLASGGGVSSEYKFPERVEYSNPGSIEHLPPSAPPLTADVMAQSGISYPSIDSTPVSIDYNATPGQAGASSSAPGGGAGAAPAYPKSESKKSSQCVICWDAPAQAVCIPCGHLAGCVDCLTEVKEKEWGCPVCRTPIREVIKVYQV
eukprot:jgi/Mesen1/2860/ME000174S02118